jgi:hypothetical protein
MRSHLSIASKLAFSIGLPMILGACVVRGGLATDTGSMKVTLLTPDGNAIDPNVPIDFTTKSPGSKFLITVEARTPTGERDTSFNGYVHLDVHPGVIASVKNCPAPPFKETDCNDEGIYGKNVLLADGFVSNKLIELVDAHGPTHVWAEDLGYTPAAMDPPPACSDGIDNDGDGQIDYPADNGCAFPNDNTEEAGTYAIGASSQLPFRKPTLAEGQGWSGTGATPTDPTQSTAATPFEQEQVELEVGAPQNVIVTRVSSDGFYATDIGDAAGMAGRGFNHVYAFNFSVPAGVRVCDRVTSLAGTFSEFYGYTELSFPSYTVKPWRFPVELSTVCDPSASQADIDNLCKQDPGYIEKNSVQVLCAPTQRLTDGSNRCWALNDGNCQVPQPKEVSSLIAGDYKAALKTLEPYEAGFVVARESHVGRIFGPLHPVGGVPALPPDPLPEGKQASDYLNASDCDLNEDGVLDYYHDPEMTCTSACDGNPECSEFNSYRSRGNFRIVVAGSQLGILANIATVSGVTPIDLHEKGTVIRWLSGTLRSFSGGHLNWTIETRCKDDLITCAPDDTACISSSVSFNPATACVVQRTDAEVNDAMD